MKKILFAAAAALAITSCSNDLSSLNGNVKAPESVPAGALFANATMVDSLAPQTVLVKVANGKHFVLGNE